MVDCREVGWIGKAKWALGVGLRVGSLEKVERIWVHGGFIR